jgi:hypothetical protein
MNWKLWTGNSSGQFQEIIPAITETNGEECEGKKEKSIKDRGKIQEKAN